MYPNIALDASSILIFLQFLPIIMANSTS